MEGIPLAPLGQQTLGDYFDFESGHTHYEAHCTITSMLGDKDRNQGNDMSVTYLLIPIARGRRL